jgi:hypothetical protein
VRYPGTLADEAFGGMKGRHRHVRGAAQGRSYQSRTYRRLMAARMPAFTSGTLLRFGVPVGNSAWWTWDELNRPARRTTTLPARWLPAVPESGDNRERLNGVDYEAATSGVRLPGRRSCRAQLAP